MQILTAPIDLLVQDPENPRAHPAENIAAIKESLARFGQVLPVLVRDSDSQIVAGNGTIQAMLELGWTECQVAIYDGSDAECRALSVALNRTGELAQWDERNLAKAVAELRTGGFDAMSSLGFDSGALDDLAGQYGAAGGGFQVMLTELPALPSGTPPLEQITFTLSHEQAAVVKEAVAAALVQEFGDTGNPNKNGNAICCVCIEYLNGAR